MTVVEGHEVEAWLEVTARLRRAAQLDSRTA